MNNPILLQLGSEQHEVFYSHIRKRDLVQYDYRDHDGELFSCIAQTIEQAHNRRDQWRKQKTTRKEARYA